MWHERYYRLLMLVAMLVELMLLCYIAWYARTDVGRYQQFGFGGLVLDTKTGYICDSYPADTRNVYPMCKK